MWPAGPEYDFYWNTRPDMKGGFSILAEEYQQFVEDNLRWVGLGWAGPLHVFMLLVALHAARTSARRQSHAQGITLHSF